jgi:hypothetical protein
MQKKAALTETPSGLIYFVEIAAPKQQPWGGVLIF